MRVFLADRVFVSTKTVGTDPLVLGSPLKGYQSPTAAGVPSGATVRYVIEEGGAWELGWGLFDANTNGLTRNVVQSSTGTLIVLTGSATVFLTAASIDIAQPDDVAAVAADVDAIAAALPNYLLKAGGTMTGFLTLSASPTALLHAAPKQYVDALGTAVRGEFAAADASIRDDFAAADTSIRNDFAAADAALQTSINGKLSLGGGTLTGFLTLHAAPTSDLHAATKKYVDENSGTGGITEGEADARYLQLVGGTLTGALTVNPNVLAPLILRARASDSILDFIIRSNAGDAAWDWRLRATPTQTGALTFRHNDVEIWSLAPSGTVTLKGSSGTLVTGTGGAVIMGQAQLRSDGNPTLSFRNAAGITQALLYFERAYASADRAGLLNIAYYDPDGSDARYPATFEDTIAKGGSLARATSVVTREHGDVRYMQVGSVPPATTVGDAAPATPSQGQLWFKTASPIGLFVWYQDADGGQWVQTSGGSEAAVVALTNKVNDLEARLAALEALLGP